MKLLETFVLFAIGQLGENAYGVPIHERVEQELGKSVAIGVIYVALDFLEAEGLISSYQGEATPERGHRKKQYFRITDKGKQALTEEPHRTAPLNSVFPLRSAESA